MNIRVTFPGGKRVDADLGTHIIATDQSPASGGQGSAPEPFQLFQAALATCAGIYVLGFCQSRGLPTAGLEIVQRHVFDDATHLMTRVELDIVLPAGFPEKYRGAVVQAAQGCKVKRTLLAPPEIVVTAGQAAAAGS